MSLWYATISDAVESSFVVRPVRSRSVIDHGALASLFHSIYIREMGNAYSSRQK